jgi:hypothetical protein
VCVCLRKRAGLLESTPRALQWSAVYGSNCFKAGGHLESESSEHLAESYLRSRSTVALNSSYQSIGNIDLTRMQRSVAGAVDPAKYGENVCMGVKWLLYLANLAAAFCFLCTHARQRSEASRPNLGDFFSLPQPR